MVRASVPPGGVDHVDALLHSVTPPLSRGTAKAAYADELRAQMAAQQESKRREKDEYHSRPPGLTRHSPAAHEAHSKTQYQRFTDDLFSPASRHSPQISARPQPPSPPAQRRAYAPPPQPAAQYSEYSPQHGGAPAPAPHQQYEQQRSYYVPPPAPHSGDYQGSYQTGGYQAALSPEPLQPSVPQYVAYQQPQQVNTYQGMHGPSQDLYSTRAYEQHAPPAYAPSAPAREQGYGAGAYQDAQAPPQAQVERSGRMAQRDGGNEGTAGLLNYLTAKPSADEAAQRKATYRCAACAIAPCATV
jgi:hypothetical protein